MEEREPDLEADEEEEDENEEIPLVYVTFSAAVNQETTESLIDAMGRCANQGAEEVHLLLSTPGGNVANGINLYNVLRGFPFQLVTHNAGSVASIGIAIYLAGDERLACPNSTFVLHGVTYEPLPGQTFEAKALRERHESVLADEAKVNSILADRTSLDAEQLEGFAESEQTKSADEAVKDGIAHRVEDINIPADAFVFSLKFDR